MPYVTSVERVGKKRGEERGQKVAEKIGEKKGIILGSQEAILEVLKTRFDKIPTSLTSAVNALEDPAYLKDLLKEAVTTPSVEVFEKAMKRSRE